MNPALGQYYTQQLVGRLLAKGFQSIMPNTLLELGAGQGNLIQAVKERWNQINVVSTEIDEKNYESIIRKFPNDRHFLQNATDDELPAILGVSELSVDIAVCNPPYISLSLNEKIERIFKSAGFERNFPKKQEITADLVFLAQNIRLLKEGGELGIILPDSFLTGHKYEWIRESLLKKHCVSTVIELPEKVFSGTEAKTHILMLKKSQTTETKVKLVKSSTEGEIQDQLLVNYNDAIYRMDYSFHKWSSTQTRKTKSASRLSKIGAEIKRGNLSRKQCIEQGGRHFHTTDFKRIKSNGQVAFPRDLKRINSALIAQKGDILLARVGKRCIGKVAMVTQGKSAITDCVYRIRVPKEFQRIVFKAFKSAEGKAWLDAHAHGVCAKVISKRDLQNFLVKADE